MTHIIMSRIYLLTSSFDREADRNPKLSRKPIEQIQYLCGGW